MRTRPEHHTVFHTLENDLIEDLLKDIGVLKARATTQTNGGMVRNTVSQLKSQKPAIGDIRFDLLLKLTFGANTVE